jgi:ABC-type sugar transport system ATPase subunit
MTVAENIEFGLRAKRTSLHCDLGFTLVYVTHNRQEAEALGSRIIFLTQGRIDDSASAIATVGTAR